jgi:mono/diheme cytochrome c family protein
MRDVKFLLNKRSILVVLLVAGCANAPPKGGDPLAQPPSASTLTDVGADLDAVLEHGALQGACDRWRAGDASERLRCGKEMFFYESFGTGGVPTVLAQFLIDNFPDDIGPGFARLGMIADPSSATHLPLGLAPTAKLGGSVDAVAFTCASCHFARLPDGRYAVGAPNHAYAYGRQILALVLLPSLAIGASTSGHDPAAVAAVQPLLDRVAADASLKNALLADLLPLVGAAGGMPTLSSADEHHYASWLSGTMDFLIAPLPVDDHVHTVSKISALWSIAAPSEADDAQLGWTGGTRSVADFLTGFVLVGGGDTKAWTSDALGPLADYVLSLRAPANPSPPDTAAVERGRAAFFADGCADCHGGPRGMGPRLYDFGEIGTDDAMAAWARSGIPAGAPFAVTGKLKAPRLVGTWAMSRFLHDGALPSLESLFCLGPRPSATPPDTARGSGGHDMTCKLPGSDARDLIAYLRAR